jgi:hypothetical protein|tara:strand:- start:715 stop:1104 length:390 start_codon:yes stop_codon:yes gene_type:complete
MGNKPEQATDNPSVTEEGNSVVQDNSNGTKKAAKTTRRSPRKKTSTKKASTKKGTTAKSKRRRPSTKPVAPPPPLTMEELREQGAQAKQEIVSAVVEPAVAVVGSLSQTIRDTISGAFAGLLSRKRRDD